MGNQPGTGRSKSFRNVRSRTRGDSSKPKHCTTNYALVFIKPHAATDKVKDFVQNFLLTHKIRITEVDSRASSELKKLVDLHYKLIHQNAMVQHPKKLKISEEKKKEFKEEFNIDWDVAVADGRILNLSAFQAQNADVDVGKQWDDKKTLKIGLGPGTAVGKLMRQDKEGEFHFVINGFYADMRDEYTKDDSKVICFKVEFEESELSFSNFRKKVIGSTNPEKAVPGSLRAELLLKWKELGLSEKPDYGRNGVHASAGPIEGLYERNLWYGTRIEDDPFGKALLDAHVTLETIEYFIGNKEIETTEGSNKTAFVVTEDMDSSRVIEEALAVQKSLAGILY